MMPPSGVYGQWAPGPGPPPPPGIGGFMPPGMPPPPPPAPMMGVGGQLPPRPPPFAPWGPGPSGPGYRWGNDNVACFAAAKNSEVLHQASTIWKDRAVAEDAYWKIEQRYQNGEWREAARRDARPLIQAQADEMGRELVRQRHGQGFRPPEGYVEGEFGYDMRGPCQRLNDMDGRNPPPRPPPPAGMSFPVKGGTVMYPVPPVGSAAEQATHNAAVRYRIEGSAGAGYGGVFQY